MKKTAAILLAALIVAVAAAAPAGAKSPKRNGAYGGSAVSIAHAAAAGNANAQMRLGFMYEYGRGIPQDYLLAAYWYRRAAEQGNPRGQHLLGLMYDRGLGVPNDYVEAYKWLNLAAASAGGGDREYFTRIRDAVASKMSLREMALSQRRGRGWLPLTER
jgi:TPR repeat protein